MTEDCNNYMEGFLVSIPTTVSGGLQYHLRDQIRLTLAGFNTDNGIRRATIPL